MGTLTDQGYQIKTENQYFADERALYLGIDTNWNLDPSSPDGLKMAHDAEIFAELDELALAAFNSKDPDKARGNDLAIIGSLTGARFDDGSPSTVTLTVGGTQGTIIPAGSTVQSSVDSTQWTTNTAVTIPAGGSINVDATAVENGATSADIGSINIIVDTVGGWQTVTNPSIAVIGRNRETNGQFRLKRDNTVARPGNNSVDSLRGELGAVDNIGRFEVIENDTGSVDANGVPRNALAVIAEGGTDEDVAMAIYIKKNPGTPLHAAGTPVVVNVTSPKFPTVNKDITFARPLRPEPAVVVNIINDGSLTAADATPIATAIINYANGVTDDLADPDVGFNTQGFLIGQDISVSRLNTPINQYIGARGNSYIDVLTVDGISNTVPVAFNALPNWLIANITVNII